MISLLAKKILLLIPTFIGITLLAFGLIRLVPGDPVMLLLGERGADPSVYAKMNADLGLDRPLPIQYFHYVSSALQGDLGKSIVSKEPVFEEFKQRFPATLELSFVALFFSLALGIPMGILAAVKRNSFWDYSVVGLSLVGYSMPIFWWGLILIIVFSVGLEITPVSGRIAALYDIPRVTGFLLIDTWKIDGTFAEKWAAFVSAFRHLILPSIALGTIPLAVFTRMTRSSLLEVIGEDYIRTARAKGLSPKRVIWIHALRNAMIPVLTVFGLMVGTLITGAILTETIFSWPGIGKWIVNSVTSRDYPVVQGGILLIGLLVMFVNLLVDLSYGWVNPRIRDLKS